MMTEAEWMDPRCVWWAKLDHAREHREFLLRTITDYRSTDPIRVDQETAEGTGEIAYRLHISTDVPLAVPLIIGDILHDLRSALDSVVFVMAADGAGRRLTPKEEKACQLPICSTPDDFKKFCIGKAKIIMSRRLRHVMHGVQPFYWAEQAKEVLGGTDEDFEQSSTLQAMWQIGYLNNLDKHRRLAVAAWWPTLVYWFSPSGEAPQQWRPGAGSLTHGSILGYASGGGAGGPNEVLHDFQLALTDLPTHNPRDTLSSADLREAVNGFIQTTYASLRQVIREWLQAELDPRPQQDGDIHVGAADQKVE